MTDEPVTRQKAEIARRAAPRGPGAPMLYAWGYADFAALFGTSPWEVAAAVVDGLFEPLSFVELAIGRAHGIEGLSRLAERDAKAWSAIVDSRPEVTRGVAFVHLSETDRPYGLGDLWALSAMDLADHMEINLPSVHTANKRGKFSMTDLASVVDYAMTVMPDRQRSKLRLV